jgi:retinol-binding protein 3
MYSHRGLTKWVVCCLATWATSFIAIQLAPGQCSSRARTNDKPSASCSVSTGHKPRAIAADNIDLPQYFDSLGPDAALWYQHVQTLANPVFEGRAPGTKGAELAADYIEFYFRQYGLKPPFPSTSAKGAHAGAHAERSYRQPFTAPGKLQATCKSKGAAAAKSGAAESAEVTTENVAAVLRGKGPLKKEWIVIGGHYDAPGHPSPSSPCFAGGELLPGADDNASGTAAVLVLAERLAEAYAADEDEDGNRRSIMFVAFAAEETGLNGSRHFVEHPPIPLNTIHAMLNLDMVGRMRDDTLWLSGMGTAAEFEKLFDPLLRESGLHIVIEPGGTGSDQVSFWNVGVPAIFVMTGGHDELHSPADTASTMNPDGAGKVIDLTEKIALRLAVHTKALTFAAQSGATAAGCCKQRPAAAKSDKPDKAPPTDDKPAALPDTPAGRCAAAFFEMFNSGDDDRVRGFEKRYRAASALAKRPIADRIGQVKIMHDDLGNLTPLQVVSAATTDIAILARSSHNHQRWMVTFQLEEQPLHGLVSLSITGPASAEMVSDFTKPVDKAFRHETIKKLAETLRETYVDPKVGKRMAKALLKNDATGRYDNLTNAGDLAQQLTADLFALCNDRHLNVRLRTAPNCGSVCGPGGDDDPDNYGFRKAEILPGNIGYIEFNVFRSGERAQEAAAAALASVADCDALIFDLRANMGGSPAMVQFLSSYLFDEPTHLNSVYDRVEDKTSELWTLESIPGKRFPRDLPVYVLTSSASFSAAEGFTYNLKNLKRVTVVGEITGGGAHMVTERSLNERFLVMVPYARVFNPATKANWEGVGVLPDIQVPASEALEAACKDAAGKISARRKDRG